MSQVGDCRTFDAPTHPQPLRGGEEDSGRATAVPLLGGVRGGFVVPIRDQKSSKLPIEHKISIQVFWNSRGCLPSLQLCRPTADFADCAEVRPEIAFCRYERQRFMVGTACLAESRGQRWTVRDDFAWLRCGTRVAGRQQRESDKRSERPGSRGHLLPERTLGVEARGFQSSACGRCR